MNSSHALAHSRITAGYRCPHLSLSSSNAARAAAALTAV
jgi:hypothetical protein